MNILLTRPEGRNQSMIEILKQHGISYIVTPLLEVQATDKTQHQDAIAHFNQADIVIFISTNAVVFSSQAIALNTHTSTQFYAVGDATYQALQALGISAFKAPTDCQQTEGLLTLNTLQDLSSKKVVIVRGVGGRETLAETLTQRGGKVDYWETYQRTCPAIDKLIPYQWRDAKVDTIIITSGEILHSLNKLVPKELFAWLRACHIIVPSSRVKEQALAYGLNKVTNAKAANCKAMLFALGLSI
ncbi:uroporphyrinogen-III synthase [Shewanella sp. D64]|uniref:uroporphyrinogen-III synthase n=1 Tax=unclassified Shewanella TaxID=196818 RepID=UPI0022BA6B4A|nr:MULTISPECIES: uroporphyrinogen-III synthase [unclassified Shewanella]MEC4726178.1 uroporphyrinogen-III synthase [Shewanella sp. D64]MEC4737906.1 uroporphyrinogen-III synthase [Shewanella sp. E94]WBJ96109.1 uroporphyrinogen-III synthase [Shewanella sp. MTB7]